MKIVWLPRAEDDLKRIYKFFENLEDIANKAESHIYEAVNLLLTMPYMGRPVEVEGPEKFRDMISKFGKGSFIIRYFVENDSVFIAYIWHSRENRFG